MNEERYYEEVLREISSAPRREGLWAKALALCDGNEDRAKHCYIKLRVEQHISEDKQRDIDSRREDYLAKRQNIVRWIKLVAPLLSIFGVIILISILKSSATQHGGEFTVDFVSGNIARLFANSFWAVLFMVLWSIFRPKQNISWRKFLTLFIAIEVIHASYLCLSDVKLPDTYSKPHLPAIQSPVSVPYEGKEYTFTQQDVENLMTFHTPSPWTRLAKQVLNLPSNIANNVISDIGNIFLAPIDRSSNAIPQAINLPPPD